MYVSPNCAPWSVTVYFGARPACATATSSIEQVCAADGSLSNRSNPMTRREKWSSTIETQWQKGERCTTEKGNQGSQKPARVGTTVWSMDQTWLGWRAITEW